MNDIFNIPEILEGELYKMTKQKGKLKTNPMASYSVHGIARRTNLTPGRVEQLLNEGKYGGYQICGQWFTTGKNIKAMKAIENMEFKGGK